MPIARTPTLNRRRPVCSLAKARACVFAQVYRALESECQAELQKLQAKMHAQKDSFKSNEQIFKEKEAQL